MSRWLGALGALLALVIGIPGILIAAHTPPPFDPVARVAAHPGSLLHVLSTSITDATVVHWFAAMAWVLWFWLVACTTVEFAAAVRGRPGARVPMSGHFQSMLAALVGAVLTFVPLSRDVLPIRLQAATTTAMVMHTPTGAARPGESDNPVRPFVTNDGGAAFSDPAPAELADDESLEAARTATPYVVIPGDTLWSIAERELGSPLLWSEIAELNYGRPQPDGAGLTDAHWIFPGWVLLLPVSSGPGSSVDATSAASGVPATAAGAETGPPSSPTRVAPAPAPAAAGPGPTQGTGPDEGSNRSSRVETSESPHPEEERRREIDTDPVPHAGHALPSAAERSTANDPQPAWPIGDIGFGVVGAGVILLLDRLRRVQRRHRPTGLRITLPDGDLAVLERRLRSHADPGALEAVDLALRALVVYSLRSETPPPTVRFVRVDSHVVEVVPAAGSDRCEPPLPFLRDPGGTSWLLGRDLSTLAALRDDPDLAMIDAPYPALVTVGHDDVGAVLLDLEQAGSIDVRIDASYGGQGRNSPSIDPSGTASETDAVLSAVAVELATSTRADQVDLVLVGFDAPLEGLDRVSQAASIADVLWRCRRRVRERQALLESVGRRHNWEIRWAEGGDAWDLGVVICTAGAVAEDPWAAAELSRLAGPDGQGLAVVLGASVDDARCHLTAHEGRIEVEMNGAMTSVFGPMTEEEGLLEGVAALVDVAGDLEGSAATEAPYDGLEGNLEPAEQRVAGAGSEPDAVEVEVRVLGPVEIVGAARPFTRAWAVELVVYLALHRKGASSEQWATALWPDRILAPSSLHSTASAARRALGVARSGDDHLPRAHGRLKLGPSVTTDWTRFVDLAARPDVASWRRALELIRGRPFDELRAPDWVLLEGIAATVEASVVDLARRYADHCLTIGGPAEAEWAARKGLQVSPYDERLYRVLLRAADVAGNPAGVESVMSELVRLVAEDIEPYDAVHPETLALYRTLSRRPTGSLGAGR